MRVAQSIKLTENEIAGWEEQLGSQSISPDRKSRNLHEHCLLLACHALQSAKTHRPLQLSRS